MFARRFSFCPKPFALTALSLLLATIVGGCDGKSTSGVTSSTRTSAATKTKAPSSPSPKAASREPSCVRGDKPDPKTSEAVNVIGAISRGAVAGYERESVVGGEGDDAKYGHLLCTSASDVPPSVPKGIKYQPPNDKAFETGDERTGWKCLKFALTQPHYYQYSYRVGSNYKGPKRGGPDPGPKGFEASAEGDLDGDGKTSLYSLVGKVNAEKQVRILKLFCVDPNE